MVGIRVRERKYDASMAKTTAMASGVNRYLAAPVNSSTGTNTMQMESVDTKAGAAICCAPSRTARTNGLRMAILRCVFSISTVASSTDRKSTRLNSSHANISYAVFCLKNKYLDSLLLLYKKNMHR